MKSSRTETTTSSQYLRQDLRFAFLVDVLLKPAGDAPIMRKKKWAVERTKQIGWVSEFIKKYIKSDPSESLVCPVFMSLDLLS